MTTDRDGNEWKLWHGGDCPIEGPVHVIVQRGIEIKTKSAVYLHWESYSISKHNIVAYRVPVSTSNATELPCKRENQYDAER